MKENSTPTSDQHSALGSLLNTESWKLAMGADTWGLEAVPGTAPGTVFPVHQVLLAKHGVYIVENVETAELAADRAYEFLFVLGQPRFVGTVQMVVNPVAIR